MKNNLEGNNKLLQELIKELDIPDSAYDKAEERYKSIGEWMDREESSIKDYGPHIFPQGSFRLGTVVKPINSDDEYDLDLSIKLRTGLTRDDISQGELKDLVKKELELYRKAKGIKNQIEEKRRCLRIEYQDGISFHMDIVPCIPADAEKKEAIMESLKARYEDELSSSLSDKTVFITDNRSDDYDKISSSWKISNPEGFAEWFEYNMRSMEKKSIMEAIQVDDVPANKRKNTLQKVIQILKRHRDKMFEANQDSKPISIIITTLATKAYNGEIDLSEALSNIINNMEKHINSRVPYIPNPLNPNEDFADKWYDKEYEKFDLSGSFRVWLKQLKKDLSNILENKYEDIDILLENMLLSFDLKINKENLKNFYKPSKNVRVNINKPAKTINNPMKPWGCKK